MQHAGLRWQTLWIGLSAAAIMATALVPGCGSPLSDRSHSDLRRSVYDSLRREFAAAPDAPPEPLEVQRVDRVGSLGLRPDILEELERNFGPVSYAATQPILGPDLLGREQRTVAISLRRVVTASINNNLDVQFARLSPAISETQVVAAEAAFDWVFFSSAQWQRLDAPRSAPSIGNQPVGLSSDERQTVALGTGVRKTLTTGGQFTVEHEFTYTDVQTTNQTNNPDPAYEPDLILRLDQPLLRNFGSEFALSQVRLARNTQRDDLAQLKQQLLATTLEVEEAYWDLVLAYRNLAILQRLLDLGIQVRDQLENRLAFDTEPAEYSDAVATVESRRADVIRAQNTLRLASDRLKLLINDPELTLGGELLLVPADWPVDEPIRYSLLDAMLLAVDNRPEYARAVISLDNTAIRLGQAANQALPQLDMRAEVRFNSLGDDTGAAYEELGEADYVDFLLGLVFEQPIGNRAGEAGIRQRRLEQMQATIALQNSVRGIVQEVIAALRGLQTNYVLIEQTRAARVAAAENLRTLIVKKETIATLSPEFLDLELRRQEALARAEQNEISAITEYNRAVARYYSATGTALERNGIRLNIADRLEPGEPGWDLYRRESLSPAPYEIRRWAEAVEGSGVSAPPPAEPFDQQ